MRGVIFDMDGVLILSGPLHFEAWRQAAARDGIELTHNFFTHTFGRTNPDTIAMIWNSASGLKGASGPVSAARAAEIADFKERTFRGMLERGVELAPGARELLVALAEDGFTLSIGSSAPRENLDAIVDAAGIRVFFASIVDGSMVTRGKPAPDVFMLAAHTAGVRPETCVVIEDAPVGIRAALAAGMKAVGVATTHPEEELRSAGASLTVASLAGLDAGSLSRFAER